MPYLLANRPSVFDNVIGFFQPRPQSTDPLRRIGSAMAPSSVNVETIAVGYGISMPPSCGPQLPPRRMTLSHGHGLNNPYGRPLTEEELRSGRTRYFPQLYGSQTLFSRGEAVDFFAQSDPSFAHMQPADEVLRAQPLAAQAPSQADGRRWLVTPGFVRVGHFRSSQLRAAEGSAYEVPSFILGTAARRHMVDIAQQKLTARLEPPVARAALFSAIAGVGAYGVLLARESLSLLGAAVLSPVTGVALAPLWAAYVATCFSLQAVAGVGVLIAASFGFSLRADRQAREDAALFLEIVAKDEALQAQADTLTPEQRASILTDLRAKVADKFVLPATLGTCHSPITGMRWSVAVLEELWMREAEAAGLQPLVTAAGPANPSPSHR